MENVQANEIDNAIAAAVRVGHLPTAEEVAAVVALNIGYRAERYEEVRDVLDYATNLRTDKTTCELLAKYGPLVVQGTKKRLELAPSLSSGSVNRDESRSYESGAQYKYADGVRVEIAGTAKEVFTFTGYDAEEKIQIMLVAFAMAR